MAQLKDLCTSIPESLKRGNVMRELNRRKALSYAQRLRDLAQEKQVFDCCQTRRPNKGKYRNAASREEMGTIGTTVRAIRTGWNSVVVCKSRKI